jgi:hypothetical protein
MYAHWRRACAQRAGTGATHGDHRTRVAGIDLLAVACRLVDRHSWATASYNSGVRAPLRQHATRVAVAHRPKLHAVGGGLDGFTRDFMHGLNAHETWMTQAITPAVSVC